MLNPPSLEVPGSVNQVCVTNFNARDSGRCFPGKLLLAASIERSRVSIQHGGLVGAGFALYLGKSIWIIKANF